MNRQEAIKALTMAGRQPEIEQAIAEAVARAKSGYAEIRNDDRLTDEWKRTQMAKVFKNHNDDLTKKLVGLAGNAVRADRVDATSVFGINGLPGDPASLVISRRDAGDRVASITSSAELRDLLARATRQGDEVFARAIADRALELRDNKTLEQFCEDRPNQAAPVERLWDAQQQEDRAVDVGWAAAMQLMELRPEEFGSMPAASIESIAFADH